MLAVKLVSNIWNVGRVVELKKAAPGTALKRLEQFVGLERVTISDNYKSLEDHTGMLQGLLYTFLQLILNLVRFI